MKAAPSKTSPQNVPLTRLFVLGWRDLARSRAAILRQHYLNVAGLHGIVLDDSVSLDDARQQFLDILQTKARPSDTAVDSLESKLVLGSRLCAVWKVLWMTILPMVVTGWWSINRLLVLPHHSLATFATTTVLTLGLFLCASFCGLLIQAVFIRPFAAFANWYFEFGKEVI